MKQFEKKSISLLISSFSLFCSVISVATKETLKLKKIKQKRFDSPRQNTNNTQDQSNNQIKPVKQEEDANGRMTK